MAICFRGSNLWSPSDAGVLVHSDVDRTER